MLASFRNPQSPLSFRCYDLLNTESYVDVTIIAEGRFLQGHKLVLAAASTYFKEIFTIIPDKHPAIVLKDISYKHLQLMLQYVYCGNVDIESEEIEGFEKVLESLKIEYDIEGPDDNDESSDEDNYSSQLNVTPSIGEITEHGTYSEMDIEEPKWNEITVKDEPKYEDDTASPVVASTSAAASKQLAQLSLPKPPTRAAQKFVKITSQPSMFKRALVTHHPSLLPSKSSTPDTKPLVNRPISMQQFRRVISIQKPLQQSPSIIKFLPKSPGGKLESKLYLGRVYPSKIVQKFMNENPGICPFCKKDFKTTSRRNTATNTSSIASRIQTG